MAITLPPLPMLSAPPQKTDPENFDPRADQFLAELPPWGVAINALSTELNKITSGLDQASPIAAWEDAPTSYSFPDAVAGSDGHTYRCLDVGVVGIDPIADSGAYWQRLTFVAAAPSSFDLYERISRPANGGSATAAERRSLLVGGTYVMVDGGVQVVEATTFDLDASASWDEVSQVTPANRAGKDFYLYALSTGTVILSANATWPTGFSAATSRKIGGFHCLGVSVGTISGHTLTGYLQGDILPASVWDLHHRPESSPEGMVYDAGTGKWVDIYLAGMVGGELVSQYGVAHQTGATTEKFHWYKFSQWFSRIGKRMLRQPEFVSASLGSNQSTNITGSANPVTTGGYVDTAGRRMISNIGCEGMCGILYQWGEDTGAVAGASSWVVAFDANDTGVGGQHYQAPTRPILGGSWADGASCGSRCSAWSNGPLRLDSSCGSRGCAEPLRAGA